ncbi:MAG: transporter, partial [Clostridia bacterium]|nr:transporter [Clostridia bacterium]
MNKKVSKSNYYVLLAVVFIGFFVFGISENIKGPAIPRMQTDFELSEKDVGLLLSLNALGYMLACSFTAWLSRKKGIKQITVLSFIVMTLSGVFIYFADSYQAFSLSYFMMYIGNGMLEIILAILAARIFINNTGMMMNLAHFFYGLSSIIAPICAAFLMQLSLGGRIMGWRGMYLMMLTLCIIPILPALKGRFPDENEEKRQHASWKKFLREPVAWLTVGILSFGTMAELAVGGWLVNYIEKVLDWEPTAASGMLSLFFIVFTASRLILGRMTDKLGYIKSLILFSAVSGILTFIAILGGA